MTSQRMSDNIACYGVPPRLDRWVVACNSDLIAFTACSHNHSTFAVTPWAIRSLLHGMQMRWNRFVWHAEAILSRPNVCWSDIIAFDNKLQRFDRSRWRVEAIRSLFVTCATALVQPASILGPVYGVPARLKNRRKKSKITNNFNNQLNFHNFSNSLYLF